MVSEWLISTGRTGARNFFQKNSKLELTGWGGVRITRFIDGGNVAGDRVL
jgi:hypothetical protein